MSLTAFTQPARPADATAPPPACPLGILLGQLILATGATTVVELDCGEGLLTLSIAEALRRGGRGLVLGCERAAEPAARARAALARAGLDGHADIVPGSLRDPWSALPGPVDLLVLGGPPETRAAALADWHARLLPGAMVVVAGPARTELFAQGYLAQPLPLGDGLVLAVRTD